MILKVCSGTRAKRPTPSPPCTAGKTFEDFDRDIVLRSAVERQFEIAGEALRQLAGVDAALAAKIPDLLAIVAFRNILIHGYALIDRARVWRVVQADLPKLREVLNDLLAYSP